MLPVAIPRFLDPWLLGQDRMKRQDRKSSLFLKISFIYLTERSQVGREAGREREEEAGSLLSREPDAGLDPRTLRS